jgi:hypothetical protein
MRRLAPACRTSNAIEAPEQNTLTVALKCKYDAWNRLVEVREADRRAPPSITSMVWLPA